jgi:hypothetical protein
MPRTTLTAVYISPDAVTEVVITGNGTWFIDSHREIVLVPGVYSVNAIVPWTEPVYFGASLHSAERQYAPEIRLIARNIPPEHGFTTVTIHSGEPYMLSVTCRPGVLWRLELTKIG